MRSIVLAAFFSIALLAAPSASACTPGSSNPEVNTCSIANTGLGIPTNLGGPCRYVDNDVCQPSCIISVHLYTENNGEPGLQRSDDLRDDTCGGTREPDRAGL